MILKGSVKYRRETKFIWSMLCPRFVINPSDTIPGVIDGVKEYRGRLIPVIPSPYMPRGKMVLVDSW